MYRLRWKSAENSTLGYYMREKGNGCADQYELDTLEKCIVALSSVVSAEAGDATKMWINSDLSQYHQDRRGCSYSPYDKQGRWNAWIVDGIKLASVPHLRALCKTDFSALPTGYRDITNPAQTIVLGVTQDFAPVSCHTKRACKPGHYALHADDKSKDNVCVRCPLGRWTMGGVGVGAQRGELDGTHVLNYKYEYDYAARGISSCYPCSSETPHRYFHGTDKTGVRNFQGNVISSDKVRACCPSSPTLGLCGSTYGGRGVVAPYAGTSGQYSKAFSMCWICIPCRSGYGPSWRRSLTNSIDMINDVCLPCQKNTKSTARTGEQAHKCSRCPPARHTLSAAATTCLACEDKYSDPRKTESYEPLCDKLTPPGYVSKNRTVFTPGPDIPGGGSNGAVVDGWKQQVYLSKVSLFFRQFLASLGGSSRVAPWLYGHYNRASMRQIQGAARVDLACPAGYGIYGLAGSNVVRQWVWPAKRNQSFVIGTDPNKVHCVHHSDCGNAALFPSFRNGKKTPVINHVCRGDDTKSFTYCGDDGTCKLCRSPRFVVDDNPVLPATDCMSSHPVTGRPVPSHSRCKAPGFKEETENYVVGAGRRCSSAAISRYCDERTGMCTRCLDAGSATGTGTATAGGTLIIKTTYTDDMAQAYQPCNQGGHCGSLSGNVTASSCDVPGTRLYCDISAKAPPAFIKISTSVRNNYMGTCMPCPQFVKELSTLPFLGQSLCIPCASGYVSAGGTNKCTRCPEGYTPQATAADKQEMAYTTCVSCKGEGSGMVTFKMGLNPNLASADDTDGSITIKTCSTCAELNMFPLGNGKGCAKCPAGRASNGLGTQSNTPRGDSRCNTCAYGYYGIKDPDAGVQCFPCPAGTYAQDRAPFGIYQDPSTYPLKGSETARRAHNLYCKLCPIGESTNGQVGYIAKNNTIWFSEHSHRCIPCVEGLVAPVEGTAKCGTCASTMKNDESVSVQGKQCRLCASGKSAIPNGRVDAVSKHDAAGAWRGALNGTSKSTNVCIDCAPGFARVNVPGGKSKGCEACPPGKYSEAPQASKCLYCPGGKFSSISGSTGCTDCPIGKSTASKPDATGTPRPLIGNTQCEIDCVSANYYEWIQLLSGVVVLSNLRASARMGSMACCEARDTNRTFAIGSTDVSWKPALCTGWSTFNRSQELALNVAPKKDTTASFGSATFKRRLAITSGVIFVVFALSMVKKSFSRIESEITDLASKGQRKRGLAI